MKSGNNLGISIAQRHAPRQNARVTAQKSEAAKNNGGISQRLKLNEWHGIEISCIYPGQWRGEDNLWLKENEKYHRLLAMAVAAYNGEIF
jgi:hypothetical protein